MDGDERVVHKAPQWESRYPKVWAAEAGSGALQMRRNSIELLQVAAPSVVLMNRWLYEVRTKTETVSAEVTCSILNAV